MKKILLLTICFVLAFTGIAFADVDVLIKKTGTYMDNWSQGEVNKLNENDRREYDARLTKYDIQNIYPAGYCNVDANFGGVFFCLNIVGLDYADAVRYKDSLYDFTGETDADGNAITFLKKNRKFRIADQNLPATIRSIIDNDEYTSVVWEDIRGFVENKLTGSIGE